MKRQFSQAQALISSPRVNYTQGEDEQRGELTRLIDQPDSGLSPELSSHLRTYVVNNDEVQEHDEQQARQNSNAPVIVSEPYHVFLASNIPQVSDQAPLSSTLGLPSTSEGHQTVWEPSMEESRGELGPQPNWILREDNIWWNQDPSSLGDVFGSGFFLHNDMEPQVPL